jgi:4-O-beta-D-mannosyl-D-glucose phosphorylase
MTRDQFKKRLAALKQGHERLIARPNKPVREGNGVFSRYVHPVLTAAHAPLFWRYDFSQETNPFLAERIGVNAAFNSGAIEIDGRIFLLVRSKGPTASPSSQWRNPAPGPTGSGSGIILR